MFSFVESYDLFFDLLFPLSPSHAFSGAQSEPFCLRISNEREEGKGKGEERENVECTEAKVHVTLFQACNLEFIGQKLASPRAKLYLFSLFVLFLLCCRKPLQGAQSNVRVER